MKSSQNSSAVGAFFKAFFTTSLIIIIVAGCAFLYFLYFDEGATETNNIASQIEILPGAEENLSLLLVIDDKAFIKVDYAPAKQTLSFEGISNQRTFEYGFSKGTVSEIASRQGYPAAAECVSAERYTYLPINNLYILSEFLGDFSFTLPKGVTFFDKNTGKDLTLEAGNQALDARRMCGIISALSKVEELDLRDYLMGKIQDDSENQKIIADMITAAAKAKLKSGTDIEKIFDKFTSLAETDISVYDFELRHSGFEKLINSGKLKFTVKEVAK